MFECSRHCVKQLARADSSEAIDKIAQQWSIRFMGVKREGNRRTGSCSAPVIS